MTGSKGQGRFFSDPFDDQNFNRVFRQYYTPLCRYAMNFVNEMEIAEDIVQDQFVYIWERNLDFSDTAAIGSYLFKAVKNRSINYIQSQAKNRNESLDAVSEDISFSKFESADKDIEQKEIQTLIQQALQSLPAKCRNIFILKRFGELSNKEIAEKLEISVKTVEAQITIAFKKLTSFISEHWELLLLILIHYL